MRTSIRLRLTLWYAGVLALVVGAFSSSVYLRARQTLSHEIDLQLERDAELFAAQGKELLEEGGGEESEGWDDRSVRAQVRSTDGRMLLASAHPPEGDGWRAFEKTYPVSPGGLVVRVARPLDRFERELSSLGSAFLVGAPLGVLLAGLSGWFLAGRALAPVAALTERARTLSVERLGERLPIVNAHDELGRLSAVINEALARIETSFEQMRRFTTDASHELRTPLAAIRSVGEVGLRDAETPEEYREIVGSMLEDVDRLAQLVESLLKLSRAEAGQVRLAPTRVDLVELVREVADHLEVLAEEKRQRVTVDARELVLADVDRPLLRTTLVNLLANAVLHGAEDAPIRLEVTSRDGTAVVSVTDSGPGIAPEHQGRIFDRFFRVDAARSRDRGGSGLGLAIARWAVEAHGGRIELESQLGKGSTFRILLPLAREEVQGGSS